MYLKPKFLFRLFLSKNTIQNTDYQHNKLKIKTNLLFLNKNLTKKILKHLYIQIKNVLHLYQQIT